MIGLNLTASDMFRNQLVTITVHSRHEEEPTVLEIPEVTNDLKLNTESPCFVVRSGQKHVFQLNESFQYTTILQLWIHTASNGIFTNLIQLKLLLIDIQSRFQSPTTTGRSTCPIIGLYR
jgi:hypothetical protein